MVGASVATRPISGETMARLRAREDRERRGEDARDHAAADEALHGAVDDHLLDGGGRRTECARQREAGRRDREQHSASRARRRGSPTAGSSRPRRSDRRSAPRRSRRRLADKPAWISASDAETIWMSRIAMNMPNTMARKREQLTRLDADPASLAASGAPISNAGDACRT